MGISGLTTFMDDNLHLLKEWRLHDTKVVIDGNNLYHLIFYNNHVDFLHGGDYDQYARKIKEFFTLLQSCNIQPYVVFDGGYEQDDKKFHTILGRVQQRLEMAIRLAKGQRGKVMPILAYETFKEVLLQIHIPFAVCDFEADKEIGILANDFDCPVLSYDSDFYILPLSAGFIPFDSVNFTLQENTREDGTAYHYLPARRYHVDNFVKFFPSLGRDVLPLLAALLGNDYVDIRIFQSFYSSVRSYEGRTQFRIPKSHLKIQKVISWLESLESYKEGIEKLMESAGSPAQKETISVAIRKTIEAFTTSATDSGCSLHKFFRDNYSTEMQSLEVKVPSSWNLVQGYNGSVIPSWFLPSHRQGILPPSFLDVITLHRIFLLLQVEHPKSQSSHQCSLKLRQLMYGILLSEDIAGLEKNDEVVVSRKCGVEEYDRVGLDLTKKIVLPARAFEGYGPVPRLPAIPDLLSSYKENFLRQALNIPLFDTEHMTKDLELVLGIILYWVRNAKPKVTVYHLQAAVVCLIMLKVKWVLIHRGPTGTRENLIETAVLETPTETVKEVRTRLHPYNARPEHSSKHPVDSELIHGFAQFQSCILVALQFNFLLQCPFPSPYTPHIFSGTFLYNFCQELQKRRSPDLFICEMLVKDSKLPQVYQCLYDVLINSLEPDGLLSDSKYKKRNKSHKDKGKKSKRNASGSSNSKSLELSPEVEKKTKLQVRYVANCQLTNRFAGLVLSDDSQGESD
ncbi:protein asteroid homolog 1-like [Saccostrea echinata]|uniref:protein asteroid homolog 1-like n=1 Tax=Saccostrea echinata TaxID=191078 RepID=UPI002A7F5562|nr:protein asteroid homolog 1-like [Saccostrea echinata]